MAMSERRFHFGDCTINVSARELRRAGQLLTISPKVFDCIAYLIEHRDRAIGRDELIAAVWGKVDVADPLLGQILVKARRAIGDSGNDQNAIRTIPRFGYRWIAQTRIEQQAEAPVSRALPEPAHDEEFRVQPDVAERAPRNRLKIAALALALAALAGVVAWQYRRDQAQPVIATPSARTATADIAVLPFDLEAADEWSWVRLGAMDFIANRLHRAGLSVVPSENLIALTSSHPARSDVIDATRKATGARYLVAPSAQRMQDEWHVELALHATNGTRRIAEAHGADLIATTGVAADRLLAVLGLSAAVGADSLSAEELLSRVQAAMLVADLATARRLLDAAPPDQQRSVDLRLRRAEVEERSGRFDLAQTLLQQLSAEVSAEAAPVTRAQILDGLGRVAVRMDQPAAAERYFTDAVALLLNHKEPAELGHAHAGRGVARALLGRLDEASGDFANARIAFEAVGDSLALARIESNEAMLEIRRNHQAAALPMLDRAAQHFERLGLPNELPIAFGEQIEARLALLQSTEALAIADKAQTRIDAADSPARRFLAYQRARALIANGRFSEARTLLTQLIGTSSATAEPGYWGQLHAASAQLDFAEGRNETALASARTAIADLGGPDYARERAAAWLVLVRALRALGCGAEAVAAAASFSAAATVADSATFATYAGIAAAEQAWIDGARDAALQLHERSLRTAVQHGAPIDIAEVAVSYGSMLIGSGDLAAAGAVIGQTSRWAEHDFTTALLQARLYQALGREQPWQAALARARQLAGERSVPAPPMTPAPDDSYPALASGKRNASETDAVCSRQPAMRLVE